MAQSLREKNRLEKRQRALDAALTVFSENGYAAATMDAIAMEAGLTKPTLYQYFNSKQALFQAMMLAPRNNMLMVFDAPSDACHVTQLWRFSWAYADVVMRPEFLSLARLVIGDATRLPDLGQAYQNSGPNRVLEGLTRFMAQLAERKLLNIEDPELAAEDFWGLILSSPRNRALHVPHNIPNIKMLQRYVHNGQKVFLRAYSVAPEQDLAILDRLISEG